jgi:DeoR family transcriptional regulator, aga operon transcriptional repressor
MRKRTRRNDILDYIKQNQHVSVSQICEEFSVSAATARRVLDELAKNSGVQRIHGGAIALDISPSEGASGSRAHEQAEEKRRIGKAAADLIVDGDTVFLGSGSTVAEVAYHLRDRRNLTVMTNSVLVIEILKNAPAIMLIGLGGILRHAEQSFIGHITEQALTELHADKVIMGIRAIDIDEGLMNNDPICTQTERAILNVGRRAILVADHTKCQRVATAFIAPVTAMHTLVTDIGAPADFVSALADLDIEVLQV